MREHFDDRIARTQEQLRKVMERTDRAVWRCDPENHVEGETYLAVTRLLQGYIENEVDMNTDNTCRENCAAYTYTESYSCFKDLYCSRQPKCSGKLINCQFVDADMWVCPSVSGSNQKLNEQKLTLIFRYRDHQVRVDMNLSNMKTEESWARQGHVRLDRQKLILGGVGCSGIVATACVSVMNKARNPIVIST